MSHRHRGTVIEIYENGAMADVQFESGRTECILHRGMVEPFALGQRGMADYQRSLQGYEWTFAPFKAQAVAI